MLNGLFQNRTEVYFGTGTESHIANKIPKGAKILLHYGSKSLKNSKLYLTILNILNDNNIPHVELGGVEPNPKSSLVYKGIELCRKHNVEFVLAAGGGSVIDSAKAICSGVPYCGDLSDFFMKKCTPQQALPLGVILTNVGSGSESNNSTVITFQGQNRKLTMDYVFPDFVIMNPENTLSVPVHTTLCGIFDAITHILELYFSPTQFVECSSGIAESLIKTLMHYADLIKTNPTNYDFRAEIMWACRLAVDKNIFLGRKGDYSCHQIAHEIGGMTNKTHAEILSVLYPSWLEYVSKKNAAGMIRKFSKKIMGAEESMGAIAKFRSRLKSWGLPISFRELDVADSLDIEKIAANCSKINPSGTIGNYVRLDKTDIHKILLHAR